MKLTNNQMVKISQLFAGYQKGDDLLLQSPTGSGKTFMMFNLMSIISDYEATQNNKIFFIFESLSKAKLSSQIYESLIKYDVENHFNVVNIFSPSNSSLKKKTEYTGFEQFKYSNSKINIFTFGSDSYKKKAIFADKNQEGRGILREFLKKVSIEGYKIIYLRDEIHTGNQSIENLINDLDSSFKDFSVSKIHFTATPDKKHAENKNLVVMSIKEAEDDNLIKKQKFRYLFKDIQNKIISEDDHYLMNILEFLDQKEQINNVVKKYKLNNFNPLMFIQISNKNKDSIDNEIKDIQLITQLCKQNNLNYYIWNYDKDTNFKYNGILKTNIPYYEKLNDNRVRSEISDNNNDIDIVFFKQSLSTGIDIPRANYLLQLRQVNSEKEFIQTIGRVKRNPFLKHFPYMSIEDQEIVQRYYVITENKNINEEIDISDNPENKIKIKKLSTSEKIKLKTYEVPIDYSDKWEELVEHRLKIMLTKFFDKKLKDIQQISLKPITINTWTSNNEIRIERKLSTILDLHSYFENHVNLDHKEILFDYIYNYIPSDGRKKCNPIQILIYLVQIVDNNPKEYESFVNLYSTQTINEKDPIIRTVALTPYTYTEESKHFIKINKVRNKLYYDEFTQLDQTLYLDSTPEEIFSASIEKNINKLNNIKTFTRHYLPDSPFFIHYKRRGRYYKSYMDFVIKLNDDRIILIETKSKENDYDKSKTEILIQNYINVSKYKEYSNYIFLVPKIDTQLSTVHIIKNGKMEIKENVYNYKMWEILENI